MKVYCCNKRDLALGHMLSWHTSRREAERALSEHRRERDGNADGPEGVDQIEIPTDRKGLIAWLNRNFQSDNG